MCKFIYKQMGLVGLIILFACIARLALAIWAGNKPATPLTGGSDTLAYQALADSIVHHRGMSYQGQPTALRPPLYPMFLALIQLVAGNRYRLVVRLIQFLAGIGVAIVCARASQKIGGASTIAFTAALVAPTLVFFAPEILSETFAALLVAIFFALVIGDGSPLAVGAVIGLAMLERFNLTALPVVYVVYQLVVAQRTRAIKQISLAALAAVVVVSPWFIRNLIVFHGHALYSTHTGFNLLEGIVMPDGRTQPGDTEKLKSLCGFVIPDIEINSPTRLLFPSEPELDRRAMTAAIAQLTSPEISLVRLTAQKLGYFWLGFDQLFQARSMKATQRIERFAGTAVYWIFLGMGIYGWWELRARNQDAAWLFIIYVIVVTALHLPFVMNTRIRAPLVEPALCILIGCGFPSMAAKNSLPVRDQN